MAVSYVGRVGTRNVHNGTASTTWTVTVTSAPGAGHLLVLAEANTSFSATGVTDARGNTWTIERNNGGRSVAWTLQDVAALQVNDLVTLTFGGNVATITAIIDEFAGIDATPIDISGAATYTASTTHSAPAETTANAADLVYGAFLMVGGTIAETSFTPATGYSAVANGGFLGNVNTTVEAEYQIVSSTGSYTPTGVGTVSVAGYGVTVAFKASASGVTSSKAGSLSAGGRAAGVSAPVYAGGGITADALFGIGLYGGSAYGGATPTPPPTFGDWSGLPVDGGLGILPQLDVLIDITNPPTSATRTWTSIIDKVRSVTWSLSGRSDELQRTSPGTMNLILDNRDGVLGDLGIAKAQWVSVQSLWSGTAQEMWRGIVTSLPQAWPSAGADSIVSLQAADALYICRLFDLNGLTFPQQRADQRLAEILQTVSASYSGGAALAGTLDTQTDTLDAVPTPLNAGSDALSASLAIEASDNGLLVAQPNGTIDYQGRQWRSLNARTALLILGEDPGEVLFRDSVTYEDDDSRLANIVNVTPYGATSAVTATDTASQTKYFPRRNQTADRQLLSSDNTLAVSAAEWLLNRYRDPSPRIPAVTVDLANVGMLAPSQMLNLLGLGNSDRLAWQRDDPAAPVSAEGHIEQITHTVQPGTSWQVTFQLSPAEASVLWILGDPVNSRLGQTTALSY